MAFTKLVQSFKRHWCYWQFWFATADSLRSETKTRQIANLLTITANHREVWTVFLNDKELGRVRDATARHVKQPVTDAERMFVTSRHSTYEQRVFMP
jgi:hypothetical protein